MAITNLDDWIGSAKQHCNWNKTATRTTVAMKFFSMQELAGSPGAGTLAGTSTTAGVVPVAGAAGYPAITAFAGAALGYCGGAFISNTVAGLINFYDRLWLGGAYAFTAATTTVTAPPSYSGRLPTGPDYNNLELWIETVTALTNQSIAVTYTNSGGTAAKSTGTVAVGTTTVGQCVGLPLASGDSGIQKIESVVTSVGTTGSFNVMVLRPLFSAYVQTAGEGRNYDFAATGLTQLFATSAIYAMVMAPAGTSSGTPYCDLTVASK